MPLPTKNPGIIKYTATILQSDRATNSWVWVEFPYDLKDLYGIGNLVPAIVTFDRIEYRGSITKMGGKYPMLLIKRDILARLGKNKGAKVEVTVTLDENPREVEIPPELMSKFSQNIKAKTIYDKLAYTHRKEYARWVGEAKRIETRQRRAAKAVTMILDKERSK